MAATATRSRSSSKSAPSAKKSSASSSGHKGPQLQIRYPRVMKANRVAPLVVGVPKPKRGRDDDETERAGLVVVRPIIPGALVTPAEQRLDLEPGNQVLFHITPLARGRLPRPRIDVFAPQQAPESIPLGMKCKTQRLAWTLLLLAVLVPLFLIKITRGSWVPTTEKNLFTIVHTDLTEDLPPVPIFNRPVDFVPESFKDVTVAKYTAVGINEAYEWLEKTVRDYRWLPNAVGLGFVVLAFMAFLCNKRKRKTLRHTLRLKPAAADAEASEASTLEPL